MAEAPLLEKTSSTLAHQVFVFPNFFSQAEDLSESLDKEIPKERFLKIYNAIFKIIEEEAAEEMVDVSNMRRTLDLKMIGKRSKKRKDREYSASFKTIKDSRDNFLRDVNNGMVRWRNVLKLIVENLILVFEKDLHLDFSLFYSRDKDEIFMKIQASETNMRIQADLIDYQVQVNISRPGPEVYSNDDCCYPKEGFSFVSPYGEFQFKTIPDDELYSIYKTYNHCEGKAKNNEGVASVFRYKDKVQLVTAMITSVVDLGELLENQIITSNFCLHFDPQLDYLKSEWGNFAKFYKIQDIKTIRRYFGEKVAMYFAYLQYYIRWLVVPSLVGLAAFLVRAINKDIYKFEEKLDLYEILLLAFSIILSFGSTLLDQLWIRKENILAWKWGTTDLVEIEPQRPAFKGEYKTDPISGIKKKIQTSRGWEKFKRSIGFTVTIFFTTAVLSLIILITTVKIDYGEYSTYLSLANAMQIKIMNTAHRVIAMKLTQWENYEYDSEYNNALTVKLYLFQFINSYSSLFFIAFIKRSDICISGSVTGNCMKELQEQLFWILIFNTFMNGFELGFPYLKQKIADYREEKRMKDQNNSDTSEKTTPLSSIESQSKLSPYETPLDDYMELVINYGYVVMFSVACPLFPLFSLLLNILEVRVDAYKICYLCQRPYPTPTNSIGTWIAIIRAVSIFGALTNTAILVFTADVFDIKIAGTNNYRNGEMWLHFVVLEHILLAVKYMLLVGLKPTPRVVKEGLIWSKRMAAEKIYGKATNLEHQMELRNLKFVPSHHEHFVLKPERIREGNLD
jgi:hypothetical protein